MVSVRIFHTMSEYVDHICQMENLAVETLVASSYLSSHLFPKNALIRYFTVHNRGAAEVETSVDKLWRRGRRIRANMKVAPCREIYEMQIFQSFCRNGLIHAQSPTFRATPNEIRDVLSNMLTMIERFPDYHVAFCQEVLPFIFIVKVGSSVTIDVRNNFVYQRIQGLVIDEALAIKEFEEEFSRIWKEQATLSDKTEAHKFIKSELDRLEQEH